MKRSYFVNLFLTAMAAISLSTFTGCQEAEEDTSAPSLSLSTTEVNIATDGGSASVEITANRDWKATSENDWVTISPAEGTGNATMTITVPATESAFLEAKVSVSISNNYGPIQTEVISVVQGDKSSAGIYEFDYETLGTSWLNGTEIELAGVNWYVNGMKNSGDYGNIGFSYFNEVGGSCYNKTAFGTGISTIVVDHKSGEPLAVYAGSSENPAGEAVVPTVEGDIYTYTLPSSCPFISLKNESTAYINLNGITINYSGELTGGNGGTENPDGPDEPAEEKTVDIAGFKADANATTLYTLEEVTVAYCADGHIFVSDETGYLLIFNYEAIKAGDYKSGDVIKGIKGNYTLYNNLVEFTNPVFPEAIEENTGDVAPIEITTAEVTADYVSAYVVLKGVKVNATDLLIDGTLPFYNKFKLESLPLDNATADVIGIVTQFYDKIQVYPTAFENVSGGDEPEAPAEGSVVCEFDNLLTAMGKVEADVDADNGLEVKDAQFDNFTITSDKGSSSYSFRLWANGKTIRSYAGNTVTITAKNGKKVTSVVFSNSEVTAATVGSFDAKTWTGSADAVTLTVGKATNTSVSVAVE